MNRQTAELGMIWGSKGSDKLQMIQALQAEVEGIKRKIAGLHASMLAADQWEAKMHGMQEQMADNIKEMQRLEKRFSTTFILDMQESMEMSKRAVKELRELLPQLCRREFLFGEIKQLALVLRREIFEFYETKPEITKEVVKQKQRPPSLETDMKLLIRRSCTETQRDVDRYITSEAHRLDDKIDLNSRQFANAAKAISNYLGRLDGRVEEMEKKMGMYTPSRKMLPAPPAVQELHDAIEKLQAQPPEELGAWTKPTTTPSEFSTLMGMINDTNVLVQKIYYDLDLVKSGMTDMDDRLHAMEARTMTGKKPDLTSGHKAVSPV
jgi:hypothetical protein